MLPVKIKPRLAYLIPAIGLNIVLVALVLDFYLVFSDKPVTTTAINSVKAAVLPHSKSCPAHCPSDPFVQPGMLHWSTRGLDNETRWMPFPQGEQEWEAMPNAYDLPKMDDIAPQAWELAPDMFTARLEQGETFDYMRGKTILFVGSSHDRNNIEQLCEVIKGKKISWGPHTGGLCHVERLDLLFVNWFLFGMVDVEDKYPSWEPAPHTFEGRFQEFPKLIAKSGFPDRKPDLAVASSLFWDQNFIDAEFKDKPRGKSHGFFWNEITWHRGRVRQMIKAIREMYGEELPLMFRTRQIRSQTKAFNLLKIFQLDQGCRAVAKEMGVKLFTWGGKLEGYSVYYDEDQHFAKGPNTYLFGDMILFYLQRATTPGCWTCHQWDD